MNLMQLFRDRYSVRKYKSDMIEADKLTRIIEAGMLAPTACNNQPQKIYVVKSDEGRAKLKEICRYTFDAPVVMVIGYDTTLSWQNRLMPGYESGETDASIVTTHMMLQAWQEGIGSCWVGVFNNDEVKATLGLPDSLRVTALMPMGYAADDAEPSHRHTEYRDVNEVVTEL